MSEKSEEIEWKYDRGIDLFHEDMIFLIEQAKKVEQLEKENVHIKSEFRKLEWEYWEDVNSLEKQLKEKD